MYVYLTSFCFFFSSRRRHTRSDRDWSSDVCSSDLTPDVLTDDTADDAVMLMLMVARRGAEGDRLVRAGAWTGWGPTHLLGTRVSGKTLGLIGLGRIGKAVAQRAHHGFGMRVIFHDPYPPPPAVVAELGAEPRGSVDDVLREADFVSLHAPATSETRHLIDARRLALMRSEEHTSELQSRSDLVC